MTKLHQIAVVLKVADTRAQVRKKKIESFGFKGKITNVELVDVYTIAKDFALKNLKKIASSLVNAVVQKAYLDKPVIPKKFTWAIEIGFLPGVTDNVAQTTKEIIEDLLKVAFSQSEGVYTSQITFITGHFGKKEVQLIGQSLANPLIQRIHIKNFKQFLKDKGMDLIVPKVTLHKRKLINEVNLNVGDEELTIIGKQGIANSDGTRNGPLALDLPYLKAIYKYFQKQGRNPTDLELESIAQTWSEHCKHTIFNDPLDEIKEGLFNRYIKKATEEIDKDFCVSVFADNSGAIEFNKDYLITDKIETHNSPSALDPFGGSVTGIVGVNRDAIGFGMGAKPIVNRFGFCFADPRKDVPLYKGANFSQKMLSSRRIMEGVIEGVNAGGNQSGIPTPLGFVYFDERYRGKPLVFVGTVGLIPKKIKSKAAYLKKAQVGDLIVVIGGRVGQDGIHGATFSSEALDAGSPAGAVQIGDPITQKKLSDVSIKEARDLNLYNSITDNGAGGLSCSVAEMAKESGGCLVNLAKVPLKYPNLEPWKIWISESQERMTLAVPRKNWQKFSFLMKKRGVEATVIGKFTSSGRCVVKYRQKVLMDITMDFLHDGLPARPMKTIYTQPTHKEPVLKLKKDYTQELLKMVARLNLASFDFISSQYDHEVQGSSVLKPLQGKGRVNAEAAVIRPLLSSNQGVVLSAGLYPSYSDIDPYQMAAASIDTAIRNAVVAGADINHLALLDNFCWCSSTDPFRLGQLKQAAKACYDYALSFQTPFISGKDSMFNDFKGYDKNGKPILISIPPTLLISSIAVINDVTKAVSLEVKFPGDLMYLLGETYNELGGSEYFAMYKAIGNKVPKVNALKNKKIYQDFHQCVEKRLITSAISVGRGGLAVALTKTALGGILGLDVSLKNLAGKVSRDDFALFSESQGRIVATVNPENKTRFEKIMKGNSFSKIGKVTSDGFITIKGLNNKIIVKTTVKEALESYRKTFKDY